MVDIRKVLFWLTAPVLAAVLVAPLFVGHVVVRLLIARIQRRARDRQGSTPVRTDIVWSTRPGWESTERGYGFGSAPALPH